ncbi:MAG: ASPIC/UnbV domain-containing protein [Planctomycetales bacterium]|nr:ASPIC/UnbV domain-containing protein [Planctomycetales bacterium]
MSQSPTETSTSEEILAYDKGWAAVNRLIRSGRSFSGRERNCCFLNVGATRFANVSAATNLNLIDDGRGLASTDWDWDGRVDFWVTNRTGPRVRFLKNEYSNQYEFLALRLTGKTSNRDGIGARVEVSVVGQDQPLIRTVRAGSGYLSQSTKWLHFGLGRNAKVQGVTVRWPGGTAETFNNVQANNRYRLIEGTGIAEPWQAPKVGTWQSSRASEPPLPASSRVVLLKPAPLPSQLQYEDLQGNNRAVFDTQNSSHGLLVNLWATWCPNCSRELKEWSEHSAAFQRAGLKTVAICVDQPTEDRDTDRERIAAAADDLKVPFVVGVGNSRIVEILNVFQRAFIGSQTDLPLPSSFLIDAKGQLAVIYKGPVSSEQILSDTEFLNASPEKIIAGAIPFDGRWLEPPPGTAARLAAVSMVEHGYTGAAESYVRQLLPLYHPVPNGQVGADSEENKVKQREYSSLSHFLGAMMFDQNQYDQARKHYQASLDIFPNNRTIQREMVRTLMQMEMLDPAAKQLEAMLANHRNDPETLIELGRIRVKLGYSDVAAELFEEAIALKPNVEVQFELANLLRKLKKYDKAIQQYREVMSHVSTPVVANNLAWLLATASDDRVRDGKEAVQLALHASEVTSRKVPRILGTLAAAHAENGDFLAAEQVAQEAIERAREDSNTDLITELQQRLTQYKNKQPTRD